MKRGLGRAILATLVLLSAGRAPAVGQEHRPVISPDGHTIAFMSYRSGVWGVYLMPVDQSTAARRVSTDPRGEWYPDWSPDGKSLIYHRPDPARGVSFLLRYDVAAGREEPLGRQDGTRHFGRWSADGRTIYSMCATGVCLMSPDGRDQGVAWGLDGGEHDPALSPDGAWIAYVVGVDGGPEDAYLARVDGSERIRLTEDPGRSYGLDWSPDGRFLCLNTDAGEGNPEVYTYEVATRTRRRLTRHPALDHMPRWAPDGSHLVFTSYRSGSERIYRVDPDGRNLHALDTSDGAARPVLFENVGLVDPATGTVSPGRWIGTRGGSIVVVADRAPSGWEDAVHVDGTGKYVAPGLIDMHVHPRGTDDLEALLASGVTATRLGTGTPTHLAWRDAIEAGDMPGPRLVVGSPYFWDRGPDGFGFTTPDADKVRADLESVYESGYDIVKVVDVYDHAIAEALFADAGRLGLPVFGHVADDEQKPFDWAWNAGLGYRTVEHLDEMVRLALPGSPGEADIASFVDVARRSRIGITTLMFPWIANQRAMGRAARGESAYSTAEEESAFLVSGGPARMRLRADSKSMGERTAEDLRGSMQDTLVVFDVLRRLVAAGVPVVPGTEGPRSWRWAGATLHDELDLMAEAGLSPAQTLRAATVDAARLLTLDRVSGRIEAGVGANLILLDENPLNGLRTLRQPIGVMVSGRWYGSDDLDILRNRLPGLIPGG